MIGGLRSDLIGFGVEFEENNFWAQWRVRIRSVCYYLIKKIKQNETDFDGRDLGHPSWR